MSSVHSSVHIKEDFQQPGQRTQVLSPTEEKNPFLIVDDEKVPVKPKPQLQSE